MNTLDSKMKLIISNLDNGLFGNSLNALDSKVSKKIINDLNDAPEEFLAFISQYGVGELSSFFRIDYELIPYEKIYKRLISRLDGMMIFGSDVGDYLYAFDTKNNWEVVELDTDGEVVSRHKDFDAFMNEILDEIIEINSD